MFMSQVTRPRLSVVSLLLGGAASYCAAANPPERHEESDPAVSYDAGWAVTSPYEWFDWSGGSALRSAEPGARVTFSFNGDSASWIGYRGLESGFARIYVDGEFHSQMDLFAISDESATRVYSVRHLGPGNHTLTIEATGMQSSGSLGNTIVVDAFDAPPPVVSHLQDSDSAFTYSGPWTHEDGWTGDMYYPWSGRSATYSSVAGATVTLPFTGTDVQWVGYRGPLGGIARVYLDEVFMQEIDTYYFTPKIETTLFSRTGLGNSGHALRIEVTGARNPAADAAYIAVDALDVTAPGTRFEEDDGAISYSGFWTIGNRNRPWSEGAANTSIDPGARATFTFTGTGVSWIGCAKSTTGIARVYLDGAFVQEVDTYHPWPTEDYQHTLYRATGLAPGSHTLAIEATGLQNPAAYGAYVVVDAFDVLP